MQSRPPKQLLLSLLGDNVLDEPALAVRAGAFIAALEATGVAEPATRVALDRMVRTGVLTREKSGREILFSLTPAGIDLLDEASDRVRGPHPFDLHGAGWTLVTFSIPEDQRALRHRLRSTLTWEGFAPIRDGLWLAPGEIDLEAPLRPLREDLPEGSIVAFHAREVGAFPIAASVRQAWDIDAIRAAHLEFGATWTDPAAVTDAGSALAARTMLVADWLALLRVDPGLPPVYMDDEWPAPASVAVYRRLRAELAPAADAEFRALNAGRAVQPAR